MNILIRKESPDDYLQITKVNDLAFGQENEGILINQLRESSIFIPDLSLVAEKDNEVVGHILYYPIYIIGGGIKHQTLSLAPMAVTPKYQKQGIGTLLVKDGLEIAKDLGIDSVIVLGHPEYYPRFGFKPASDWKISAPFDIPDGAFMAMELIPDSLNEKAGIVEYPQEYYDCM
jgi:predicted N-acetyltransferase YhbS